MMGGEVAFARTQRQSANWMRTLLIEYSNPKKDVDDPENDAELSM